MVITRTILIFSLQFSLSAAQSVHEATDCFKYTQFGNTEICLPEIVGMKECYEIPLVKHRADDFEYEGNSILGFYVTNNVYEQIDRFDQLFLDEYFKIYAVNNLKDKKASLLELNEIASMMDKNFIKENWDKLKTDLENNKNYISFGKPVIIESYSPNDNAKTYLMLDKIESGGIDYVMLTSINIILVKERLIWLAYYMSYNGEESIVNIKSNNDYTVLLFITENE